MTIKGVKTVSSKTRKLGGHFGDNVQVFYDAEDESVFGIYQLIRDFEIYSDESIIYVTTYYRPATQKEIEDAVRTVIQRKEAQTRRES